MGAAIDPDQFLLIIGSAKSGTTSLFEYLRQHPAVCPSVIKEPEYFSKHQMHPRHVRRYEDLWPDFDSAVHRYALEGSTGYTKWPVENGVAERMRAYGIRPRLIYLVRDPVERIESHVNYIRITSRRRITFEDSYPIDVSRYATQIAPFVEVFGREAIRVLDFAHLRADPYQVCDDLHAWLGLEPHTIADPRVFNETESLKRSHLDRVLVADSVTIRRTRRVLPPVARRLTKKVATRLVPYRHKRMRISSERARQVRELLREDVDRLAAEWGMDVSPWGFDNATHRDTD
ncbi:MAG: sulfotransferase domain-containing protein [Mycobacteriaceae bacterium]